MLSCKEFVQQTSDIIDDQQISFAKKFSIRFHMFICHHCRKYLKQLRTTVSVANNLQAEATPEQIVEKTVIEMKQYSERS